MMYEGLSSGQMTKRTAEQFVELVRKEPVDDETRLRFLASIPVSQQCFLADAVVALLSAGRESRQFEAAGRMHSEGIKLLRMTGLSFPSTTLKDKIIPTVIDLARETYHREEDLARRSHDLMERVGVLAQLASRIDPSLVDECIETLLYCARFRSGDGYDPSILTMLAAFGPDLKDNRFAATRNLREKARTLCAGAVSKLLADAVEKLADYEPSVGGKITRYFSIAHWACDGLLSVLPALWDEDSDAPEEYVASAIDSLEWFVRKPNGYPGYDFGETERRRFDFLRGTASIVLGVVALKFSEYEEMIRVMRLPKGPTSATRGSVFLRVVRENHPDVGVSIARDLVQKDLLDIAEGPNNGLTYEECFETSVLAWHLGSLPQGVLRGAFEELPPNFFRSRAYLTRALDRDAWLP
jgi:hypothetical protein